jgi:hypothetical protein
MALAPIVGLREESILNLAEFHVCVAFFVVVCHAIDPRAHRIAPHQPSIVGLQQFGHHTHPPYSRIKLEVVAVWIKNDWHAVVDG